MCSHDGPARNLSIGSNWWDVAAGQAGSGVPSAQIQGQILSDAAVQQQVFLGMAELHGPSLTLTGVGNDAGLVLGNKQFRPALVV